MWPWVIIPRWIVTRVKIPRWNVTPAHNSTLNCDPGSWFHVELRPTVSIQRWVVTPSHDSTLNCPPCIGITIQRGILTQGHNSTWNFDPGLQFNVEFWSVYISSTSGIATQEGVKIQQHDQNSTAKEGHNSTKNPLNIDPESVFNWGVKILSYTGIMSCADKPRVLPNLSSFINYSLDMDFRCVHKFLKAQCDQICLITPKRWYLRQE